ncbi:hypothetical protein BGZ76_001649 [Entomortierella beljakovae]|nr:hypothetical protein BGZ76_001649 [Entomortierella beljakovae]
MRYMIERGLYIADMLNRTLVLPNHLRIRQCSDNDICKQTAIPLDLDTIGRNDQGSIMTLDLGYFFNLPHLSRMMHGRVVDYRTFMERIVGLPKGASLVDNQFGAQTAFWQGYLQQQKSLGLQPSNDVSFISSTEDDEDMHFNRESPPFSDQDTIMDIPMKRVKRETWDLEDSDTLSDIQNLIRNGLVDNLEEPSPREQVEGDKDETLMLRHQFYAFADVRGGGLDKIAEWSLDFEYNLKNNKPKLSNCRRPEEEPNSKEIPWEARFPAFATCRIENYVGIKQELSLVTETILSIEGQFHTTGWIPIIYSSIENAHKYRDIATTYLKYSPTVYEAAEYLMRNLGNRVLPVQSGDEPIESDLLGSSWLPLSMHVRRGDFVTDEYGWQEFSDSWMKTLVKDAVDATFKLESPSNSPLLPRYFYMATDELSPSVIDYFHSLGAILFEDLIDDQFEERFNHLIVYDDWIGLVEQIICAKAKSFYGTMTSSFTSGIINMRFNQENSGYSYLIKAGGPILTEAQARVR